MRYWGRLFTQLTALVLAVGALLLAFRLYSANEQAREMTAQIASAVTAEARLLSLALASAGSTTPQRAAQAALHEPRVLAVLLDTGAGMQSLAGDPQWAARGPTVSAAAAVHAIDAPALAALGLTLKSLPRYVVADQPLDLAGRPATLRVVRDAADVHRAWRAFMWRAFGVLLILLSAAEALIVLLLRPPVRRLRALRQFAAGLPRRSGERLLASPSGLQDLDALGVSLNDAATLIEAQSTSLAEAEARQRYVLSSLDELVYQVDADGRFRYANAAWQRALGRDPQQLVGTLALDCVAEADRERISATFAQLHRGELPAWRGTVQLLAADGGVHRFEVTANAIVEPNGRRRAVFGMLASVAAREAQQRQLEAERQLLQDVVDALPFALSIKGLDDRFLLVNRALARLLDSEPARLRGKPALEQGPPHLTAQLRPLDARAAAGERVEADLDHSLTGQERTSRVGKLLVQLGVDRRPAILTYAFDTTEQRRAAAELQRQRGFLRAVIDADEDCIYAKDTEGRYVLVNHAFLAFFDLREADVLGRTMTEVFGALPSVRQSQAADDEARRSGQMNVVEQTIDSARGPRRMLIRRSSILSSDGAPWLLGVARDVTELRGQEDQLRRQQQFMSEVINLAPSQIFVRDAQMRYVMVNAALARLLGRPAQELIGRTPREFVADDDEVEVLLSTDRRVLAEGIEVVQEETLTLGGRRHHFIAVRRPIVAPDGSHCLLGISTDITELREREVQLREAAQAAAAASDAKSRFLANMSHELRTPMNGVIGMIDLALRTEFARDRQRFLALAQSSAEALLAIVDDVLDVSKVEAGMMTVERVPFSLYELLRDVSWAWAARAEEKGLLLLNRFGTDLPLRPCSDPTRLRQVLNNLLGNAIKFTATGRVTLDVAVDRVHDGIAHLRFGVTDSGPGIAEEQQARIFEAFAQADESVTRRFGGTGLGLTISARLVELMGGQLALDSALGKGAAFSFTLPMPLAPDEDGRYAPMLRHLPSTRILWIDPCTDCRQWFDRMLTQWGAAVTAVASIAEALDAGGTEFGIIAVDHAAFEAERSHWNELLERAPQARVCMLLPLTKALPLAIAALGERAIALTKPLLPLELHQSLGAPAPAAVRDAAGPAEQAGQPLRGLRLLLAEDNAINRSLAQSLLGMLGADVQVAEDGAQALDLLQGGRYDLVLMDVQMPVLDGIAALGRLREREAAAGAGRRMPAIAMTAHAVSGDRERLLAAGFDGYVGKPFRPADLAREIRRLVPLPATAPAPVEFDADTLLQSLNGDRHLARQVARAFASTGPAAAARLKQAIDSGDASKVKTAAHELKGMAGALGARRLHELATALEAAAAHEAWPAIGALHAQVDAVWQQVVQVMDAALARTEGTG